MPVVQRLALAIVVGIVGIIPGALLGLLAAQVLIPILRIPTMEGQQGLFAIFVCVPIGGMIGFVAAAVWFLWKQGLRGGALTANIIGVIAALAVIVWGVHSYLNPPSTTEVRRPGSAPVLDFEIRTPAGTTLTSPYYVEIDLVSANRPVRAALHPAQFRQDGNRPVIVGSVEVLYRTGQHTLILNVPGQVMRRFSVTVSEMPRLTTVFGEWEQEQFPDRDAPSPEHTHHVRYRVTQPSM